MKVFCIAYGSPENGGAAGSLWRYKREDRDAELGDTGAEYEVCFTLEVPDGATSDEITAMVDAVEQDDSYTPEDDASDDCPYCEGQGEVQGRGSYADFEPPIVKCSQCGGTRKVRA